MLPASRAIHRRPDHLGPGAHSRSEIGRHGSQTRHKVWTIIQADPGVHKSDICRLTGLSWGTVSHHISRLHGSGRIRLHRMNNRALLFPLDVPRERWEEMAVLRNPQAVQVLDLLVREPRATVPRLAELLGASAKSIRRTLANLQNAGLIAKRGQVRPQFRVTTGAPARELDAHQRAALGMLAVYQMDPASAISIC